MVVTQDVSKRLSIEECLAHPWVPCSETDGLALRMLAFGVFSFFFSDCLALVLVEDSYTFGILLLWSHSAAQGHVT